MIGPTAKIKGLVKQFTRNRAVDAYNCDSGSGALIYLRADKRVDHHCDSPATLCFIRGEGTIAINDTSAEYRDGKWFDVPGKIAYQIIPDIDTVMLTIEKPTNESSFQGRVTRRSHFPHIA